VTIFASGVSNSAEIEPAAFRRERELLLETIAERQSRLVYFSTCSLTDPDRRHTPYVLHKRSMEELVAAQPGHIILRLPQLVGRTGNPHTLVNFLADRIRNSLPFEIWSHARRCVMDVETVAALTICLLETDKRNICSQLMPPELVTMPELVQMLEEVMGKRAIVRFVEKGDSSIIDPSLALSLASLTGEDLGPGYTFRTLKKYFGSCNAN
jgi:nucleoside-diphosphate-sugar epimerase